MHHEKTRQRSTFTEISLDSNEMKSERSFSRHISQTTTEDEELPIFGSTQFSRDLPILEAKSPMNVGPSFLKSLKK